MFDVKKRIRSELLVGIEKDDGFERYKAPLHSTGDLVYCGGDEQDPREWFLEYRSEVSGEIVRLASADTLELVRQALKAAGIIER